MSKAQPGDPRSNQLLGTLETASRKRIDPHLEPIKLKLGDLVARLAVLRHRQEAVRRLLDAALDRGPGQYKRAKAIRGGLAIRRPRMPTSNDRKLHAFGKRIAMCSHITASDNPVLAPVGCARFVESLIWVSAPWANSPLVLHSRAT
jgi:hypothetical protein